MFAAICARPLRCVSNELLAEAVKGTMSEAELHVLRGRLNTGRINKARRGELFSIPPIGYVKLPTGDFAIDPDEQVQAVVRLIFDQFDRLGSVHGVIRYLVRHGIRVGVRPHYGPNRGNLEWRYPSRWAVQSMLTHPIYAGAYRHGYRRFNPRRKKPGKPASGRVLVPPDQYIALIPDRMPAYITMERYQANQKRLRRQPGPLRSTRRSTGRCITSGRSADLWTLRPAHDHSLLRPIAEPAVRMPARE
jgi:hypothetical protein